METSLIDTVAKYFYFLTLDEQLTFAASFRVLGDLKTQGQMSDPFRPRWVGVMRRYRGQLGQFVGRDWAHATGEHGFVLPKGFALTGWSNFLHNGDIHEIESVLFTRILGFSDEDVALGLGVTVGTIRYRTGRGLRSLGGYLES